MVLKNADYLARTGKLYEVRAVIVPDLYDTPKKSIREMGDFLAPYLEYGDIRIKIIAYRPMGVREQYSHFQVPDQKYLAYLAEYIEEKRFSEYHSDLNKRKYRGTKPWQRISHMDEVKL